jgi:hypothetical protein
MKAPSAASETALLHRRHKLSINHLNVKNARAFSRRRARFRAVGVREAIRALVLKERLELMGISTSLVLIAVGAILKWAVTATTSGINLNTVGVVLMVVGAVGLVLSLIFWSSWGGFGSRAGTTTVVREDTRTLR